MDENGQDRQSLHPRQDPRDSQLLNPPESLARTCKRTRGASQQLWRKRYRLIVSLRRLASTTPAAPTAPTASITSVASVASVASLTPPASLTASLSSASHKKTPIDMDGAPSANGFAAPSVKSQARVRQYFIDRAAVVQKEDDIAFDYACKIHANTAEILANDVIQRLKLQDKKDIFDKANTQTGYGKQEHPHFPGDHFLTNEPLIAKTELLKVAKQLPKGSHLHIHFNACLQPSVLLEVAKGMDRMFITSDLPLVLAGTENFFLCEIQFSILSKEKEKDPGDLFSAAYKPRQTMRFKDFLDRFPADQIGMPAMDWLASKLVFCEAETYDIPQTSRGAWERFNGRTRMMKGLFNYATAYRKYTELFLQNLLDDNIQYAEIRPNFMMTNHLWSDDGTRQINNAGIIEIIVEVCEAFKAQQAANKAKTAEGQRHFDGIKIIYCTPRSFSRKLVEAALDECFRFKERWPQYIAGFDLVGEEAKGQPLREFVPELLAFQDRCREAKTEIPFLFHCGETLEMGTDVDGNLVDALLLGSKRIGHGFALPRHPHILQEMKRRDMCVEVCPISNEILGLTPRIGGHAVYSLLANNMPCTANSDNGTLFKSTLSHDFYQIMVGKADMGLFGWRQLAEWSLKHACMSKTELAKAREHWLAAWSRFIVWLLETYDASNSETQLALAAIRKAEDPAKLFAH